MILKESHPLPMVQDLLAGEEAGWMGEAPAARPPQPPAGHTAGPGTYHYPHRTQPRAESLPSKATPPSDFKRPALETTSQKLIKGSLWRKNSLKDAT